MKVRFNCGYRDENRPSYFSCIGAAQPRFKSEKAWAVMASVRLKQMDRNVAVPTVKASGAQERDEAKVVARVETAWIVVEVF